MFRMRYGKQQHHEKASAAPFACFIVDLQVMRFPSSATLAKMPI